MDPSSFAAAVLAAIVAQVVINVLRDFPKQ